MQSKLTESRLAMFASFGLAGKPLDRDLRHLKTPTNMVDIWRQTQYTPGMFAKFEAQNAKLLDMHGEVSADIAAGRTASGYTYLAHCPLSGGTCNAF